MQKDELALLVQETRTDNTWTEAARLARRNRRGLKKTTKAILKTAKKLRKEKDNGNYGKYVRRTIAAEIQEARKGGFNPDWKGMKPKVPAGHKAGRLAHIRAIRGLGVGRYNTSFSHWG